MIEIQTDAGFAELRLYPTSVHVTEKSLTAEVIDEPGIPSYEALVRAWREDRTVRFRIEGWEVDCRVRLGEMTLEPKKVMFRMMELIEERR